MKTDPTENHIKEASNILRHLRAPDQWQDSSWVSSPLVKSYLESGKSPTHPEAIQNLFADVLATLAEENPDYGAILRGRYWEELSVKQMVGKAPHFWQERNFYILQNKAIFRFTSLLLDKEAAYKKRTSQRKLIGAGATLLVLVAALLALIFWVSPSLASGQFGFSAQPATSTSPNENGQISFQKNFEDGLLKDFKNKLGLWIVVPEADGNNVLDVNTMDTSIEYPTIEFGDADWKNFVFESRINMLEYSTSNNSPLASIRFRGNYKVAFTPYWKSIELVFEPPWKPIASRTIEIQKGKWYSLRIQANGSEVHVFLDNKLVISDSISQNNSGVFGFATWPRTHIQFDDIVITLTKE